MDSWVREPTAGVGASSAAAARPRAARRTAAEIGRVVTGCDGSDCGPPDATVPGRGAPDSGSAAQGGTRGVPHPLSSTGDEPRARGGRSALADGGARGSRVLPGPHQNGYRAPAVPLRHDSRRVSDTPAPTHEAQLKWEMRFGRLAAAAAFGSAALVVASQIYRAAMVETP